MDGERTDGEQPALRLDDVGKVFGGSTPVTAVDGVSLTVARGTFTAVMGPSGSGKSTLLHCAAGLEHPTTGRVTVDGTDLTGMTEDALARFRRTTVGFVFQSFNLLPYLTAYRNTELPLRLAGRRVEGARVADALAAVSLADRRDHLPAQLSGGEQQRVAVARALVTDPAAIFADEPTGALDSTSAREVLALLRHASTARGRTIVMVTHDPVAASYADSVVFLADGRLAGRMRRPTADAVAAQMTHLGDLVAPAGVRAAGVGR